MNDHEARTETVQAGVILVAGRLVDGALAPELGLDRDDGHAVRLHAAVAAAFADGVVDEHPLGRIGKLAALAAAALLGGAGLIVDERGDALDLAELALHGVELVAMMHLDAARPARGGGILVGLVGHDDSAAHPFRL